MQKVPTAIMMMVVASTRLRPMRSPSGPKKKPPSGRTKNAAENVANAEVSCAGLLAVGKKTSPRGTAM
jgi:hypothetical protein